MQTSLATLTVQQLHIPARDGYPLAATLLEPAGPPKGVIQFQGGTGVLKEFYTKFTNWLAGQGYVVVRFDYRGIGGSRPASLRGFPARLQDWPQLDWAGVLDWLSGCYPDLPIYLVGHSIGTQLAGLLPNYDRLQKIVAITSSTGTYYQQPFPHNLIRWFLWYGLMPVLTATTGYGALKRLGLMEDLPKDVLLQWGRWCKHEAYFGVDFGKSITEQYFDRITVPFLSLEMADDNIATPATVQGLLRYYRNAAIQRQLIQPAEAGVRELGHFGFFRSKFQDTLWPRVTNFLAAP